MISFEEYLDFKEDINEMSTVFRDRAKGILIQVNPDRNRMGDEYFKLFDSAYMDSATKMCRISFRKPVYIIHSSMRGKEFWRLNSREKKLLINSLMRSSGITIKDKCLTNWEYAIYLHNIEKGFVQDEIMSNTQPDAIPIDLEMPDYNLLFTEK